MAITFPEWYKGGYPDAELAVKALLDQYLSLLSPVPGVCAWLPDDYMDHLPLVAIQRVSGRAGDDGLLDRPLIHIWAITDRRHDSWQLIEYIRQAMLSYKRGGVVKSGTDVFLIKGVSEVQGPELTQTNVPDERAIPIAFEVELRPPTDLPDYSRTRRQIFG